MPVLVDGELVLYGFVGDDFWDEGFTASQVINALAMLGREADITVRLNSGGGYIDDGIAVYNALTAHRGDVHIVVDAVAASSASIIAMAGDTVTMRAAAQMMIHDPARFTWGTAGDHEQSTEQLNRTADLMAEIYADRTGDETADIRDEMKDELWMTGAEAVERGFADETEGGKVKAVAAFDYRIYAHAPKKLVAAAKKERWSFDAVQPPAASAAQPPAKKEKPIMATTQTPADPTPADPPNPAAPVSAADVKARIKAITNDDAAKGHEALARHLAFDTEMPAEEAIAALAAAASDAPAASEGDPASSPAAYQAGRSAAADLAQPGSGNQPQSKSTVALGAAVDRTNKRR